MNRRTFLHRLATMPLIGGALATLRCAGAAPTPAGCISAAASTSWSTSRPHQVGTPGVTYFHANSRPMLVERHPSAEVYLDGQHVRKSVAFELDIAAGWVGVRGTGPDCGPVEWWGSGKVELRSSDGTVIASTVTA